MKTVHNVTILSADSVKYKTPFKRLKVLTSDVLKHAEFEHLKVCFCEEERSCKYSPCLAYI